MRVVPLPVGERVYQLKVTLRHIRPLIWRRLQVRGDTTLGELNRYLQVAMGWWNSHLHLFQIGRTEYRQPDPEEDRFWESTAKDENAAVLAEVVRAEKARFRYVYDFGDHWEHEIVVEKILPRAGDLAYPVCLAGQRACPPEDCAGPGDTGNSCRHCVTRITPNMRAGPNGYRMASRQRDSTSRS